MMEDMLRERLLFLALVSVGFLFCCRKGGSEEEGLLRALTACDFAETCSKALGAAMAVQGGSGGGDEVRRHALRVALEGQAAFPGFDTGKFAVPPLEKLAELAKGIGEARGSAIAEFLAAPSCEKMVELLGVEPGDFWAWPAWMAVMKVLAQSLSAMSAERATAFAIGMRHLVECTLSPRTPLERVPIQARKLLSEVVGRCEQKPASLAARATCEAAREVLDKRDLPLPWPDAGAGNLVFASLPQVLRGIGIHLTPSFAFVVVAGRLGLFDQVVLEPGVYEAPEIKVDWLLDLRGRYHPHDLLMALKEALEKRKAKAIGDAQVVFLVVDSASPTKELLTVLQGLLAASDAVAAVAAALPGQAEPTFVPVNYYKDRVLIDPTGRPVAFGRERFLQVRLRPFSIDFVFAGRATSVELQGPRAPDLRPIYKAAVELVQDETPSAIIEASDAVPVGLLVSVLETLAFRMPNESLASLGAFASSSTQRAPAGGPRLLCRVLVVQPLTE